MFIQPIKTTTFKSSDKKVEAKTEPSSKGVYTGALVGAALAGALYISQMRSLKTISGKRNLILGYQDNHLSLNSVKQKVVKRDENGKIIFPKDGINDRTKAIVKEFKTSLALWGAGIVALSAGIGKIFDSSANDKKTAKTVQ